VHPDKHNKCKTQSIFHKTNPCKSHPRVQPDSYNKRIPHPIQQLRTSKRRVTGHITIQVTDYIHTAKGHQTHRTNKYNRALPSLFIVSQVRVAFSLTTARQVRASHTLHRLSLRDNARLSIIKQHHFQFLTLKQIP
jgi:hypothetical protein